MPARHSGLSRSAFLILLSLADRPRHGLGVVEEVETRTAATMKLGPGTLYGTLKLLSREGLVRETTEAPDPSDDDPRRRYYALTPAGREALEAEARRLRELVRVAEAKRVLAEGA